MTLDLPISEIRQSRAALRDSEALYHSLVDQLPMCLLRKNLDGQFIFANSQFFEFSGKSSDEVIGRTDFDLFPEELARKYQADDQTVIANGEVLDKVESHQVPGGGGQLRYVQILKTPVFDSARNVIGTQVLFWDVTEKHVAATALKESTALKRAIFDFALDCILLADQDGVILDVNRSTERVFGFQRNELIGCNMDVTLLPPSARSRSQRNRENYDSDSEGGSMLGKRAEIPAQHKDGRVFDVEMAMQPIPYEGRTVFAIFLHDITERKRAEEEIAQKNKDLETLLYVTSHDLREPLRAIRSFTQLLSDRAGDKLNDVEQGFLTRVVDGADRLNKLLEDVLIMSRAQRASEGTQLVDAKIVARDVIRQFDVRIAETQGSVKIVGDLLEFRVDPRWLRQSLFNLVGNALKFHNDGEPPQVEIEAYKSDCDLVVGLVVRDRGPGIAAEHEERVFQLFQRAVGRKVEGTGAGLAIVRQISNRYGGEAWYKPRVGGGAEFVITFQR
jgi:PAS domain S-box-containing protein